MTSPSACTLFINASAEEIAERYEEIAIPANGYLTRLNGYCLLVDATAAETADWQRQIQLSTQVSGDQVIAVSIFMVGDLWALALAHDGQPGPVAAFTPDNAKSLEALPAQLLAVERMLGDLFADRVDIARIDELFGGMIEGALSSEEVMDEILDMLGCPPDWQRWSWYETIPEQLFLDPDLSPRVMPLGDARALWDE
jgi:hypothetical protein